MDSDRNKNFGRSGGAGGRGRGCGVGGRRRGNYQDQGGRRRGGSGRGWNASLRDGPDLLSESKESQIQTLRRHERGGSGRWRDSPEHCPPRQLPTRVYRPPPLSRPPQTPKQGQLVVASAKRVQPQLQPHTPSHERGGSGRWRDSPEHCPPRQLPTRVYRPPPLRRPPQTPKQGQLVVASAKPVQPQLQPHTPSQPGHPLIEGAWSKTWRAFCFTLSARLFLSLNCSLGD